MDPRPGSFRMIYVWFVWLAQGVVLLAAGGMLVARPLIAKPLLPGLETITELELVELFAPLSMGLGALTLQVLRPSFAWMRESLASAFFGAWLVAFVLGCVAGAPLWIEITAVVFAIGNLIYVRRPAQFATPPSARPNASAEAPMLGRFWAFQMLYYVACGVLALALPEWVVSHIFESSSDAMMDTEIHILRFAAALYFTMAIISHHAIGAQTDETWRGFCQAFLTSQWACAIAMTVAIYKSAAGPGQSVIVVILPNLLLALVNTLSLKDRRWIRRFMDTVRGSLVTWWSVQVIVLVAIMLMAWFDAALIVDGLSPAIPDGGQRYLATDSIRLLGPLALGAVALTVLAMFRRDRRARHDFARLFVVFGGVAVVMRLLGGAFKGEHAHYIYDQMIPIVTWGVVGAIVVNALVWLFPDWRSADELYRGAADTKPRWVYKLCAWQALFLLTLAGICAITPDLVVHMILQKNPEQLHPLLRASVRCAAPFWALMGATSAFAAASSNEWSWRGLCRWFSLWQAAFVITFVYVFDSHLYVQSALIVPTIIAALAALNVLAARSPLQVDDLAGQPQPTGWLMSDAGSGAIMALRTLWRRARPYHRVGVAATGTFELATDSALPRAPFFEPRDEPLLCTVRFSNRRQTDDATLDYRGCAIRLTWPDASEPLDLLMSTGAFGHTRNAAEAVAVRWAPKWMRRKWLQKRHAAREASIAGLRRAPASYAELHYYTQLVRLWRGANNGPIESRRCRLRLVPEDGAESGLPDVQDQDTPWDVARRGDESRSPDYLRSEFDARIVAGGVRLRLQVQISPAIDEDEPDVEDALAWYDATVDWDLPWLDVGTLVLDKGLPPAAGEFLRFDPGNGAGVIVTPLSPSWTDPRSLAATQDRVVKWVGQLRMGLYRLLGRRQ